MTAHQIHGLTRKISEMMLANHGIIMTVGVYSYATGDNKHAKLQKDVIQTLAKQEHIVQVHGFYYDEASGSLSVDVVPDRSVTDDESFIGLLKEQLNAAVPGIPVSIIIDHNYSE